MSFTLLNEWPRRWRTLFTSTEVLEEFANQISHQRPELLSRRKLALAAWTTAKEKAEFKLFCNRLRMLRKWKRWKDENPEAWRTINRLAQARRASANVERVRALRHRRAKARPPLTCAECQTQWCNIPRQGWGPTRFCSAACKRRTERRARAVPMEAVR